MDFIWEFELKIKKAERILVSGFCKVGAGR
jgi:hypothetical protein